MSWDMLPFWALLILSGKFVVWVIYPFVLFQLASCSK